MKPLIPVGGNVIDIGANVGYLSGLFARWVGAEGRVTSFEPIPATFDALSSSMRTLFPQTVTTIQSCVSDREGEVTMAVPDYAGGGANYYESHIIDAAAGADKDSGATFTVPATTLDLITRDRPVPDFIKIDVEGHELSVIRGGAAFFARHQPPLLIEVAGDPDEEGSDAAALIATLAGWGYAPMVVKDGKLVGRVTGDKAVDYLFVAGGGWIDVLTSSNVMLK